MKKDLILFGMQGCGKGTQAWKLLELFDNEYSYFSTWDVFRALISKSNAIGDYAKFKMNAGLLISDEVTISIFYTYFLTVLDSKQSMLLDGYPRTKKQIDDLFALVEKEGREIIWVFFDLSEEEAIKRMKARGRDDDTDEAIRLRLQQYYDKTVPVIDYFDSKGTLIRINADNGIDEIFEEFKKVVG